MATAIGWFRPTEWREDGRELYFVRGTDGALFAVPIALSPELAPGEPELLFQDDNLAFRGHRYDVTPDGQRFLVPKVLEGSKSVIRVVDNWFAELKAFEGGAQ